MVKPITPDEVADAKTAVIPSEVLEAFNEEIALQWSSKCARVMQDAVVKRIRAKMTKGLIFDHKWLNVEDIYRAAGWSVSYDSPAYNESYPAYNESYPAYNESYPASFTFRRA